MPYRAELIALAMPVLVAGCGGSDCQQTCTEGAPIEGTLTIHYDGFAGRAPERGIDLRVQTASDRVIFMRGCGCSGGRFWWIELGMSVPEMTPLPAAFDEQDPEAASASAFLMSCAESDCGESRKRTWYGRRVLVPVELDGTLSVLDPSERRLVASVTLRDPSEDTLETAELRVEADLTWNSLPSD